MAALQRRGDSYRLIFQYLGQQHSCTLGDISQTEAQQCKTRCEQLLMRELGKGFSKFRLASPSPNSSCATASRRGIVDSCVLRFFRRRPAEFRR